MAGWTKGPWAAEKSITLDGNDFWSVYGADHSAVIYATLRDRDELAANSRLIAEAPAMAEALREVVTRHKASVQNWTQNAVDAHHSGRHELSIDIQNMALAALDGFPIAKLEAILARLGEA